MSIDSIIYVIERPIKNAEIKIDLHNRGRVDPATGKRLIGGNGCHYWDNCFDCPFPPEKCYYDNSNGRRLLKKTRINAISNKQRRELEKRRVLKALLISEFGNHCMTCGDRCRDFRGISLSHIIPLARGGVTRLDNVELLCYYCHSKKHGIKEV